MIPALVGSALIFGIVLVTHVGLGVLPYKGIEAVSASVVPPPHIPSTNISPNSSYVVPWWLGVYISETLVNSAWTLPLSYQSGGSTYPGTTLVVENKGPANITLFATSPETIQGASSFIVVAGTTAQLVSGYDWIVTSASVPLNGVVVNLVAQSITTGTITGQSASLTNLSVNGSLTLPASGPATMACQNSIERFDANGRFVGCTNGTPPITTLLNGDGTFVSPSNQVNTYFANVKDYGAIGNGVADDTVAIQAAFDALYARGGSKNLYFASGTYLISSPIIFNGSNWLISGYGATITTKTNIDILRCDTTTISSGVVTIQGLFFLGQVATSGSYNVVSYTAFSGLTLVTVSAPITVNVGDLVKITGTDNAVLNAQWRVAQVVSSTSFTLRSTGNYVFTATVMGTVILLNNGNTYGIHVYTSTPGTGQAAGRWRVEDITASATAALFKADRFATSGGVQLGGNMLFSGLYTGAIGSSLQPYEGLHFDAGCEGLVVEKSILNAGGISISLGSGLQTEGVGDWKVIGTMLGGTQCGMAVFGPSTASQYSQNGIITGSQLDGIANGGEFVYFQGISSFQVIGNSYAAGTQKFTYVDCFNFISENRYKGSSEYGIQNTQYPNNALTPIARIYLTPDGNGIAPYQGFEYFFVDIDSYATLFNSSQCFASYRFIIWVPGTSSTGLCYNLVSATESCPSGSASPGHFYINATVAAPPLQFFDLQAYNDDPYSSYSPLYVYVRTTCTFCSFASLSGVTPISQVLPSTVAPFQYTAETHTYPAKFPTLSAASISTGILSATTSITTPIINVDNQIKSLNTSITISTSLGQVAQFIAGNSGSIWNIIGANTGGPCTFSAAGGAANTPITFSARGISTAGLIASGPGTISLLVTGVANYSAGVATYDASNVTLVPSITYYGSTPTNLKLGTQINTVLSPSSRYGMPMIPGVAGTPTSTPIGASSNDIALVTDSTNNLLYFYSNSAWRTHGLVTITTPASSSAACIAGQIVFDSNYIYTCVATNTWRRSTSSVF